MTFRDLSGIFTRYFLTGFFLPAFAALAGGSFLLAPQLAPRAGDDPKVLSRVVVLTAFALLLGLLLQGIRRPMIRLFEGYPLMALRARFARDSRLGLPDWARPTLQADRLWESCVGRQHSRRQELLRDESDQGRRELERRYGTIRLELLPTRFGNILRAFEYHADSRWGLSGLAAWPRIAPLLSDREHEYHLDAETDVMFFLNLCLLSLCLDVLVCLHALSAAPATSTYGACVGLFLAAWAFYQLTLPAAISWGVEVRASIDLHRLELYERLGVRMPDSFSDERVVAQSVARCLEFGERIPDALWGPKTWKD